MMQEFGWDKADIISSETSDYNTVAESIRSNAEEANINIINWIRDVPIGVDSATMRSHWAQAKLESRSKSDKKI